MYCNSIAALHGYNLLNESSLIDRHRFHMAATLVVSFDENHYKLRLYTSTLFS